MQQSLSCILETLLNETDSLGVGCLDTNGLLIDSKGEHSGKDAHKLACYLSHIQPNNLANYLGDSVTENIIMGHQHHFYLKWLADQQHLVYVMTHPKASGSTTRQVLHKSTKKIFLLMQERASGVTLSQRLEQPRKFIYLPTLAKTPERLFQKL